MKVIVIVYNGSEVRNDKLLTGTRSLLEGCAIDSSKAIIKQYNEEDLIGMGVKNSVNSIVIPSKEKEIEHAVTYIVGKFSEQLNKPVQLTLGFLETLRSSENKMLKNAINIIYENRAAMTDKGRKEFGLPNNAFRTIISFKQNYDV